MALPPTQQNNRPIGFVLDNQGSFSLFNLTINPENGNFDDEGWLKLGCIVFSQYFDSVWWLANQLSKERIPEFDKV